MRTLCTISFAFLLSAAAPSIAEQPALKFRNAPPALNSGKPSVAQPVWSYGPASAPRTAATSLAPGLYAAIPFSGLMVVPPLLDPHFVVVPSRDLADAGLVPTPPVEYLPVGR